MTKLLRFVFIIFFVTSISLYAQEDTTRKSTGNLYQDLSGDANTKAVQYLLVLKNDKVLIDTLTLIKIDPDWVDKVEILRNDNSIISESSNNSSILIYIRQEYINDAKKLIEEKQRK